MHEFKNRIIFIRAFAAFFLLIYFISKILSGSEYCFYYSCRSFIYSI